MRFTCNHVHLTYQQLVLASIISYNKKKIDKYFSRHISKTRKQVVLVAVRATPMQLNVDSKAHTGVCL